MFPLPEYLALFNILESRLKNHNNESFKARNCTIRGSYFNFNVLKCCTATHMAGHDSIVRKILALFL
jgi:hypothetical protein